jgi:site-specific DNA-methyltransferase (adenine-specific)
MELNDIIDAIGVEPFHREEAGVIYCADCLDILPKIPAGAIDLVLTDPPYGVRKTEEWDAKSCFEENINQWLRACLSRAPRMIWFCADKMLPQILENRRADFFRLLIWNKPAGSQYNGASHNNLWYSSEFICLFGQAEEWSKKGGGAPMEYSVFNSRTIPFAACGHPTTKPTDVIEWLAIHHSDPNDIILDPFLGSGTTAVACKELGRKFIGIEIEEKYCRIAVDRLRQGVLAL